VEKWFAIRSGEAQRVSQTLGQLLRRTFGIRLELAQDFGRATGLLGQHSLR
jgi:hypothetical protein